MASQVRVRPTSTTTPKKQSSRVRRALSVQKKLQEFEDDFLQNIGDDIKEEEEPNDDEVPPSNNDENDDDDDDDDDVDKDRVRENANQSLAAIFGGTSGEDINMSISKPTDGSNFMNNIGNASLANVSRRKNPKSSGGSSGQSRKNGSSSSSSSKPASSRRQHGEWRTSGRSPTRGDARSNNSSINRRRASNDNGHNSKKRSECLSPRRRSNESSTSNSAGENSPTTASARKTVGESRGNAQPSREYRSSRQQQNRCVTTGTLSPLKSPKGRDKGSRRVKSAGDTPLSPTREEQRERIRNRRSSNQ